MSIFDELRAHAQLPFDQARMLPLEAYSSDAVLDAELATVFAADWQCVARTADLAAVGDYVCADLPVVGGGVRPIVVIRGDDTIRAFDNVCIHRGAQLLADCGNERRITCPYHAWVYRLDGSLVGGPHMGASVEADGEPFRPERHRLSEVRLEIWQGFVFVNLDADAEPLGPRLAGLDEVVGRFAMDTYVTVRDEVDVWPTNWKLLVENFMDAYHVFQVHKDSFGSDGDSTLDTEMFPGTLDWAHHRVVESDDLAAVGDDRLADDWRRTVVLAAVFPGFVIQLQPDWLWFLRITPIGTDRVRIAWQVAVAPATLAAADDPDAYIAALNALVDQVNGEDHPVVAGIRRSVDRPQFDRAPLSYLERNVYDFDRYLASRLSD
ncbi:MAG: aromatic ring-hydroxylating dioxygenase subunit alpha [Actinomycetota bacterium]